ncbi:UxaA family hydrolase [Natronoglomus mannanivorans]|uniref:UxaA family hydrolase n=1 Tax=Natronoglomus mannanivorans TaxID=2979990 RepID=A0AAP3E1X0_9EURY|nr:UxaA family hydrolase [Halobacteria archaeon AArc-xg1-1]
MTDSETGVEADAAAGADTDTETEATGTRRPSVELDESDTVVTVLEDAEAGDVVTDREFEVTEAVPFGHKVALTSHDPGDEVRKYGEVIGVATEPIEPGEWVHTHNCDSARGKAEGRR